MYTNHLPCFVVSNLGQLCMLVLPTFLLLNATTCIEYVVFGERELIVVDIKAELFRTLTLVFIPLFTDLYTTKYVFWLREKGSGILHDRLILPDPTRMLMFHFWQESAIRDSSSNQAYWLLISNTAFPSQHLRPYFMHIMKYLLAFLPAFYTHSLPLSKYFFSNTSKLRSNTAQEV